ncbi:MAG: hypothetical protein HFG77_04230 [Hungatella sp.]|jgi:hypothetical protein|nr:hypothetical protein [Hungatella sp.]
MGCLPLAQRVRERFCRKKSGEKEYDDQKLEKITMVMTLKKFGFGNQEIADYFCLEEKGFLY